MTQVVSVTAMADPKAQRARQAAQRVAKVRSLKASTDKMAAAITAAEKTANSVFVAFNTPTKPLTAQRVAAIATNLNKMHAGLGKAYRQAAKNLALSIAMETPTARALGQMEAVASLKNKVASLIVQAKASVVASEDELPEDVLPVDESGYVVEEQEPASDDLNAPGVIPEEEVTAAVPPTSDPSSVQDAQEGQVNAADEAPEGNEEVPTGAPAAAAEGGDDLELSDDDAAFEVPNVAPEELTADNLDLPEDGLDEVTAALLLAADEAPEGNDSVPTGAPQTAVRAQARDLRRRTAASTATASIGSEDAALKSMMAELAKP